MEKRNRPQVPRDKVDQHMKLYMEYRNAGMNHREAYDKAAKDIRKGRK